MYLCFLLNLNVSLQRRNATKSDVFCFGASLWWVFFFCQIDPTRSWSIFFFCFSLFCVCGRARLRGTFCGVCGGFRTFCQIRCCVLSSIFSLLFRPFLYRRFSALETWPGWVELLGPSFFSRLCGLSSRLYVFSLEQQTFPVFFALEVRDQTQRQAPILR